MFKKLISKIYILHVKSGKLKTEYFSLLRKK